LEIPESIVSGLREGMGEDLLAVVLFGSPLWEDRGAGGLQCGQRGVCDRRRDASAAHRRRRWLVKLRYDPESGALYVRVKEGAIEETVQHADGVYLDIDAGGRVIGAEFLTLKELAEVITAEGGRWELPERIEDPDSYEASRAESLTKMRSARRPA